MKTKMLKMFSLALTFIMLLSAVPFSASAATIKLTKSNITQYPTFEGFLYVGQTERDKIKIIGGEVQYEGVVVPGHFEHSFPDEEISPAGETPACVTFIPDDETAYARSYP